MFKKIVLLTLALSVSIFGLVFISTPVKSATETWRYSYSGLGADASFSTCNYWPIPAGTNCTDTFVFVAEQVYKSDGTKYPISTMWVSQYSYTIDKRGNWNYVSDSWGYGDATLSIDKNLSTATASASMVMSTCTIDKKSNYKCQESILPLTVNWTGVGDLIRSNSNSHTVSKGYNYHSTFKGTYRAATAEVIGLDAGPFMWASIYNSRWSDVYISHGGW